MYLSRQIRCAAILVLGTIALVQPPGFAKGKPLPPPSSPPAPAIAFLDSGDLVVMNADGSNRLTVVQDLAGRSGLGPTPAWSPDGTQLAYFGAERTLTAVNLDGTVHTLSEHLPQWVGWWDTYPVAWGEDGIVFANHVSVDDTHTDLFMVQPDGSGLVNLFSSAFREVHVLVGVGIDRQALDRPSVFRHPDIDRPH